MFIYCDFFHCSILSELTVRWSLWLRKQQRLSDLWLHIKSMPTLSCYQSTYDNKPCTASPCPLQLWVPLRCTFPPPCHCKQMLPCRHGSGWMASTCFTCGKQLSQSSPKYVTRNKWWLMCEQWTGYVCSLDSLFCPSHMHNFKSCLFYVITNLFTGTNPWHWVNSTTQKRMELRS